MNDSTIELDLKFPYLAGLNERQREAVLAQDGPVLVLAGAGTGKTRALTTRLAHLLMTGKARPFDIMAVTFTNKAAGEMKARVGQLIGRPVEGWWLGTFHALAARILRQHAEAAGLKPNFTIIDTDDQLRLIKQIIQAEGLDSQKWPSRVVLHHRAVERSRPHSRQGQRGRAGRSRRRTHPRHLSRVSAAARHAQRLRFRRPAAAQRVAVR